MARQNTALGMLRTSIAGAALLAGLAAPALADDKLTFSGSAALTTDYVFRGVSQTDGNAAIQGEFDATWKIFYLGMWGSNLNFGGAQTQAGQFVELAQLEADWYGGIRPVWKGMTFDIGGIYYSYPNSFGPAHFNYAELKTGASYTFFDKLTLGLFNYYTPNNFGDVGRQRRVGIRLGICLEQGLGRHPDSERCVWPGLGRFEPRRRQLQLRERGLDGRLLGDAGVERGRALLGYRPQWVRCRHHLPMRAARRGHAQGLLLI